MQSQIKQFDEAHPPQNSRRARRNPAPVYAPPGETRAAIGRVTMMLQATPFGGSSGAPPEPFAPTSSGEEGTLHAHLLAAFRIGHAMLESGDLTQLATVAELLPLAGQVVGIMSQAAPAPSAASPVVPFTPAAASLPSGARLPSGAGLASRPPLQPTSAGHLLISHTASENVPHNLGARLGAIPKSLSSEFADAVTS